MKEINPDETSRAEAFRLWMNAPMPMVTLFKTMDVTNLVRTSRKNGLKFNMLMCWCIGKAASGIKGCQYHRRKPGRRGKFLRHSFLRQSETIQRGLSTSDAASGGKLPEPRHH